MSNSLRQVVGGRLTWRARTYTHPALDLLPDGSMVWCVAAGPHRVAVWRYPDRRNETPLCVATPVRPAPRDPAQLALHPLRGSGPAESDGRASVP